MTANALGVAVVMAATLHANIDTPRVSDSSAPEIELASLEQAELE